MIIRLRVSRRVGKIGKKFARELKAECFSAIVTVQTDRTESCQFEQILNFQFNKSVYNSYSRCQHQLIYFEQIMENSRISGYPEDY